MRPIIILYLSCLIFINPLLSHAAPEVEQEKPPHDLGELTQPEELRSGGLLFRVPEGYRQAPTLETDVSIEVAGLIARTRVIQRFTNPTEDWVEGVYVFPLPNEAAVDSLRLRVGDRLIAGRIEERARAKATYEKAKADGKKAGLVEQERPNLFTTQIANLGPQESVEVLLTYQEEVEYDAGLFRLRFPMVVGPRFIPGDRVIRGFAGTGWGTNTPDVPDAERITPPVAPPGAPRQHPLSLRVEIDSGFPLDQISSGSHAIRVERTPASTYRIELAKGDVPANADFVLEWRPEIGSAPAAALFRETWQGDDYALLMVLPPEPGAADQTRLSRETIIVIDTSGSMGGESIVQARSAVDFALGTLKPEDAFNVIRFHEFAEPLFDEPRAATGDAIRTARNWVARLDANGGTNMLPALEAALRPSRESRAVRQVIFVTDGAVGNEEQLFRTIEQELDRTRLFTIGIGSAPNSHFMTKAAKFGRGTFTYIGRPEEVAEKMSALFRKLERPVLHDLALDWSKADVEAWPARIPDVYVGEPVVVAARLPRDTTHVTLRGRRGGEDLTIELPLEGGAHHEGVAKRFGRRKIAALMETLTAGAALDRVSTEVAALGLRHQLVTRWTSLVAVDVTPSAPADVEAQTRAVPTLLPKGWDFLKLGLPADSRPAPPAAPPSGAHPGLTNLAFQSSLSQSRGGRLPQGGTPQVLFLSVGCLMLGGAGLLYRGLRRTAAQS